MKQAFTGIPKASNRKNFSIKSENPKCLSNESKSNRNGLFKSNKLRAHNSNVNSNFPAISRTL